MATFEVKGARELRATLRQAGDDLSDLKAVHKDAATIAADAARQETPRVSGALAATVRAGATKTAGIVRVGNNRKVPYANPIHWGWPKRNIKPQPFAANAARHSEPRWLPIYQRYVITTLDKIKGI